MAFIILAAVSTIAYSNTFDVPFLFDDRPNIVENRLLKDLADLSGMSSETVIRILKNFKEEGLIEMDGKDIKILNFEQLRRISETG